MSKKLTFVILVALAALLAAAPALAASPSLGKGDPYQHRNRVRSAAQVFSLTGVITALESDAITILVHNGNRAVQSAIGTELTVQVTESTRYTQWTPDGCSPISFDDLEVDDTASIQGTVKDGTFTANRVTVDVPCCTP